MLPLITPPRPAPPNPEFDEDDFLLKFHMYMDGTLDSIRVEEVLDLLNEVPRARELAEDAWMLDRMLFSSFNTVS